MQGFESVLFTRILNLLIQFTQVLESHYDRGAFKMWSLSTPVGLLKQRVSRNICLF